MSLFFYLFFPTNNLRKKYPVSWLAIDFQNWIMNALWEWRQGKGSGLSHLQTRNSNYIYMQNSSLFHCRFVHNLNFLFPNYVFPDWLVPVNLDFSNFATSKNSKKIPFLIFSIKFDRRNQKKIIKRCWHCIYILSACVSLYTLEKNRIPTRRHSHGKWRVNPMS